MNLVPVTLPSSEQVYVKNLLTGEIVLASTSSTGEPANFGASGPNLSADGTRVAFMSAATNFDPRDTDVSVNDIYVKDLVTGEVILASTSDSGIKSNDHSTGGYQPICPRMVAGSPSGHRRRTSTPVMPTSTAMPT